MPFEGLLKADFEVEFHSHARSILSVDFPQAIDELEAILLRTSMPIRELVGSGGGEAAATQRMRRALASHGWVKTIFEIKRVINGVERAGTSHQVDHVKAFESGTLALEIEWNNKDPFFDRDLENFKRLHAEGAISAGIIVTRGASLQAALRNVVLRFATEAKLASFADLEALELFPTRRQRREIQGRLDRGQPFATAWSSFFVADKFGEATTHWRKLQERVNRGVGNPCPLLLIGLPDRVVAFGP
jgi:hypothetical protein